MCDVKKGAGCRRVEWDDLSARRVAAVAIAGKARFMVGSSCGGEEAWLRVEWCDV
jgi:hypothetical protein